jgi:hypothetical protein
MLLTINEPVQFHNSENQNLRVDSVHTDTAHEAL